MPINPDPKLPDQRVSMRDFPGLVTASDPHDIPLGAGVRQINAQSMQPGELRVRRGTQVLKYSE
jgi:hypothetical protein